MPRSNSNLTTKEDDCASKLLLPKDETLTFDQPYYESVEMCAEDDEMTLFELMEDMKNELRLTYDGDDECLDIRSELSKLSNFNNRAQGDRTIPGNTCGTSDNQINTLQKLGSTAVPSSQNFSSFPPNYFSNHREMHPSLGEFSHTQGQFSNPAMAEMFKQLNADGVYNPNMTTNQPTHVRNPPTEMLAPGLGFAHQNFQKFQPYNPHNFQLPFLDSCTNAPLPMTLTSDPTSQIPQCLTDLRFMEHSYNLPNNSNRIMMMDSMRNMRYSMIQSYNPYSANIPPTQRQPHIKKPLNAFMLYMKEVRPKLVKESQLKDSIAINKEIGKMWQSLTKQEQSVYFDLAKKEREIHRQMYPNYTSCDSFLTPKKRRKKRDRVNPDEPIMKKCRARYGLKAQDKWCKPCRRKKRCARFTGGAEEEEDEEDDNFHLNTNASASRESDQNFDDLSQVSRILTAVPSKIAQNQYKGFDKSPDESTLNLNSEAETLSNSDIFKYEKAEKEFIKLEDVENEKRMRSINCSLEDLLDMENSNFQTLGSIFNLNEPERKDVLQLKTEKKSLTSESKNVESITNISINDLKKA